jgi:hypothetical protein
MIKPGYKTSEFWFTLVSFLFSGLYLLGLIGDNGQKEDLIRDVSHGVESIILIGGQLAILWKYINSRKQIKQTWFNSDISENKTVAVKTTRPKKAKKPTKAKKNDTKRNSAS